MSEWLILLEKIVALVEKEELNLTHEINFATPIAVAVLFQIAQAQMAEW
jgi:hypothetical protein